MQSLPPSVQVINQVLQANAGLVRETPVIEYYGTRLSESLPGTDVLLKMELFQRTGSFKPRGALQVMRAIPATRRDAGVTAFSAGNHAIATAYAASCMGLQATVAMPKSANPLRVQRCREFGAEIVFGDTIGDLLGIVERLQQEQGRVLVHPFEGEHTVAGTATVALEMHRQGVELEALIVPVGGGGLIAGVASAMQQLQPHCQVFGVEPAGADGMRQSLRAGAPSSQVSVNTIADSLGAPLHLPYTFELIKNSVTDIVTVDDDELVAAMRIMQEDLRLAVEPAAAAALAALLGPLHERCRGLRTGLIICGSNIDVESHQRLLNRVSRAPAGRPNSS